MRLHFEKLSHSRLHFEKLSRYARINEPVSTAVPIAQGALSNPDDVRVVISDGVVIVPQAKPTAHWPDGSVKWLHLCFSADLPGNAPHDVWLTLDGRPPTRQPPPLAVDGRAIACGALSATLSACGAFSLFDSLTLDKKAYASADFPTPTLVSRGRRYNASIDSEWKWTETGPYRAIARTRGRHFDAAGDALFNFELALTFFAGHPWFEVEYRFINTEDAYETIIEAIYMDICPNFGNEGNATLVTSNYGSRIMEAPLEEGVGFDITSEFLLYESNEQVPETLYGTFFADISNDAGGICATVFQAQQNFPKSLNAGRNGIRVGLYPESASPLTVLQGVSKTHRMLIHPHGSDTSFNELNIRSLQYQLPDKPLAGPELYRESQVLGDIFPDAFDWAFERNILARADSLGRAFGMLHWGDFPDPNYTGQGRGRGKPVWTNNEYDTPRAYHYLYARCCERRILDRLFRAAEHQMDVDICHHSEDPLLRDAQIIHSADHVTAGASPCHEWVEGLLDYYHLTGDDRAFDCAVNIGENVLRHLDQPRYHKKGEVNARETGWALRTLTALYVETGEEKWLERCDWIVGHFNEWKEAFGGWLSPYTDHTAVRVPFMIAIAGSSLMRYYRVRPSPMIRAMILDATDDLIENAQLPSGEFYYKELPSLRSPCVIAQVLELLAYAYELTEDPKYIRAGIPTNEVVLSVPEGRDGHGTSKEIIGDALIINGADVKTYGEWHLALVLFHKQTARCREKLRSIWGTL